jgi:hypothetical protein
MNTHYFHSIPLSAWVPFWSCDSSATCQMSPNSGDTSRPIFAHFLQSRSYRPLDLEIPCGARRVMSHACLVSSRMPQPAVLECLLLLLRVPVGCRRAEAGSAAVVVDLVHGRLTANTSDQHASHNHNSIIASPSPRDPAYARCH